MGARLRALRTNDQTVLIRPKVDLIVTRELSKYNSAYDLSLRGAAPYNRIVTVCVYKI